MTDFHSGFVAVIGRPNVGKSTLVNTLLGQKVAAVSPRAQTTRRRQLGILTTDEAQLVFVDTPGLHQAKHKLGEFLNQEAVEALSGVDVLLFLVDGSHAPEDEDRQIASRLKGLKHPPPILIGLNKADLMNGPELDKEAGLFQELLPGCQQVTLSALNGAGCLDLVKTLVALLPKRSPDFPPDQLTDLYEREIAADLIRESALNFLRDEVPHGLAVRIDEFTERSETGAYIAATLFVERESQKGIVIGEGARMLKQIGSAARYEIETMGGRKVFLQLRVKVAKGWRDDEHQLERLGYKIKKKKK